MPTNVQNGQIMHANGGWLVQRATASLGARESETRTRSSEERTCHMGEVAESMGQSRLSA